MNMSRHPDARNCCGASSSGGRDKLACDAGDADAVIRVMKFGGTRPHADDVARALHASLLQSVRRYQLVA
jgi:hypothetical protein